MKTKPESEVVPVAYPTSSVRGFYSHRDWTADRDVAIARAHEMASRRAKSLIKQADAMKSYKATFRLLSSDQE